jgi:hypothetical protein
MATAGLEGARAVLVSNLGPIQIADGKVYDRARLVVRELEELMSAVYSLSQRECRHGERKSRKHP